MSNQEYQAYLDEQQAEQIEQLASYQAIKEWLEAEKYRAGVIVTHSREVKFSQLEEILDLCAKLVTAEPWGYEEIIAEIEEELT